MRNIPFYNGCLARKRHQFGMPGMMKNRLAEPCDRCKGSLEINILEGTRTKYLDLDLPGQR